MRNRPNKPATNNERTFTKVDSLRVLNAREWEKGDVTAAIVINGITIYNVRIMQTKDGDHEFLSFPSRKGNDGKYYHYVYMALSNEDTEKIIEAIDDYLARKE